MGRKLDSKTAVEQLKWVFDDNGQFSTKTYVVGLFVLGFYAVATIFQSYNSGQLS